MAEAVPSRSRVSVDGKFFRLGTDKLYIKGLAYGPFAPSSAAEASGFPSPEQAARDFAQIRSLGANTLRIYEVPPKWFLDFAAAQSLKLLVDVPWRTHVCFLDSAEHRQEAFTAVRRAVVACAHHPAVLALSVANEIAPDVVRWSGAAAIADFIDELIVEAKHLDSECLCTFANYPPTEYLRPQNVDFNSVNVYLHQRPGFSAYLARLQMSSEGKPLLLGEIGIDSLREGAIAQSEILSWQIEESFRAGLAGTIVFRFTDDWWRSGELIEDWHMGITTRERQPKPSAEAVRRAFLSGPYFPLPQCPKVSIVVATYNGARTLPACLESLERLRYPAYELILVDDGSTDTTREIAFLHPEVRYFRHERNLGLSAARNTGIAAATGQIVAFTDSDCRADEDWLYYLVGALLGGDFVGVGGPNLLPPDDSPVAAAVMASPGGPAHVMLTDRQAEHVPGCNMAFFKWALEEVGGFDPQFRQAGDDVDLCWRLQQAGYKIGFSPSGIVWHYRRSTVAEYLRQQRGYGEAEALLVRKHPEYFNSFGGSLWKGRIYSPGRFGVLVRPPMIYHGSFGSAGYQALYRSEPASTLMLCTTLEFYLLAALPLWILSVLFRHLLPLAVTALALPLAICAAAGAQAVLPRSKTRSWSRALVALLFLLQPIVRGWARYRGRLLNHPPPLHALQSLDSLALRDSGASLKEAVYWAAAPVDRLGFVAAVLRELEQQAWPHKADIGWCDYDVEIFGTRWNNLQLTTVSEELGPGNYSFRCRLRGHWSLAAKTLLGAATTLEVLVCGIWGRQWPGLWLLLASLAGLAWALSRERRTLRSITILLLDEVAKQQHLTRTSPPPRSTPPASSNQAHPDPTTSDRHAGGGGV